MTKQQSILHTKGH